ncbi:uncharacterized protein LOC113295566 [Papaver somniferum]|uniref:uncharacterized protein LOC113295566 n=1 Tax=Papaver somniferum TaxID=3469 RepID=UPI000E7014F3|nr:uncharacterized protein LOC113295566 [Papaver somniferum]
MGETSDSSKNPNENKTVSFADLVKGKKPYMLNDSDLLSLPDASLYEKEPSLDLPLELTEEGEDKKRVWHGDYWTVQQQTLRVFNFYPNFDPERQNTSCASIWVSFPCLYIELWTKRILLSIAKILGKPIVIDQKILDHDVGNYADVLIDIDFAKPIPKRIRLKANGNDFWQYVEVQDLENIKFCTHCKFMGHKFENCLAARKILGNAVVDGKQVATVNNPKNKEEWKIKKTHAEVIISHVNHVDNINNIATRGGSQSRQECSYALSADVVVIAASNDQNKGNSFASNQEKETVDNKQLEEELNNSFIEYPEAH